MTPRPRATLPPAKTPRFEHAIRERVLIPANARPAHRRLRARLAEINAWSEAEAESAGLDLLVPGSPELGIVTNGVSFVHAREAAPEASILKIGLSYPLPLDRIRKFAATVKRLVVVEEGDPCMADAIRAAGIGPSSGGAAAVESKAEMYRFGELTVARVRRILDHDLSPEPTPVPGKPPALCPACPHRGVFDVLHRLDLIVAGDIGCYALGALPPFEAMDSCVCMGAALGVGLGLRHSLPPEEARRVVSILGDSTFVHSGLTGLVEMAYNKPATGHVLIIMDNGTTAMTGLQEHPGTGRKLNHEATTRWSYESFAKVLGIERVYVCDPVMDVAGFEQTLKECLASGELAVIVTRRPCILASGKIKQYEKAAAEKAAQAQAGGEPCGECNCGAEADASGAEENEHHD